MCLRKALLLIIGTYAVSARTLPFGKTFEEGLRQDYLLNVNNSIQSWPDVSTLYRLMRYQPRHIHLSYGDNPLDMVVTWSTLENVGRPVVEFGRQLADERNATGVVVLLTSAGSLKLNQYIHQVTLKNLDPGETYVYRCGSNKGWSSQYFFTAMPSGTEWMPRVAIYGDMGAENAQSLPHLKQQIRQGAYDVIIHNGDFAYDIDTNDGVVGDAFMSNIQPVSAYIPYMTVPGNHERAGNFMQYKRRFAMPGQHDSMFYSWNMGPIHFIGINTEVYFDPVSERNETIWQQYNWLQKDLQMATSPKARSRRPWIIVYGHTPAYCSNRKPTKCLTNTMEVRVGFPELDLPGLEDILAEYGVDLAVWAHKHSYERLFPLYNTKVYKGSEIEPYANPRVLTHVITGSAGSTSDQAEFGEQPQWSAFRSLEFGYSTITVINATHLNFEQISVERGGQILDSFTLVRERHEAYGSFKKD